MDIFDVSKLSEKVFFKVNYSFKSFKSIDSVCVYGKNHLWHEFNHTK